MYPVVRDRNQGLDADHAASWSIPSHQPRTAKFDGELTHPQLRLRQELKYRQILVASYFQHSSEETGVLARESAEDDADDLGKAAFENHS